MASSRIYWERSEGYYFGSSRGQIGQWVIDPSGATYALYMRIMEQGGVYPRSHQQDMGRYPTLAAAKKAALNANRLLLRTQGPTWRKATRSYAGKARRWR
jgi:hypothetical protein